MPSLYQRGRVWWVAVYNESGKRVCRSLKTTDKTRAAALARRAEAEVEARKRSGYTGPVTLDLFSDRWIKARRAAGVRSVETDAQRYRSHVGPVLGSMEIDKIKPRDVLALVAKLKAGGELASRTVNHVLRLVSNILAGALLEELVETNAAKQLPRGVVKCVDKDPTWRANATFTVSEVEKLISSPEISQVWRVAHALRGVAGLRLGEVAGLRWNAIHAEEEPLGRLDVVASYNGPTKTKISRTVPLHPTLAAVLAAWRLNGWEQTFGRAPRPEDLVVPDPTCGNPGTMLTRQVACPAFVADLRRLGLRSGRGGHALRSFLISRLTEQGAVERIAKGFTHASGSDVYSGYVRVSWAAKCAEIVKLDVRLRAEVADVVPLRAVAGGDDVPASSTLCYMGATSAPKVAGSLVLQRPPTGHEHRSGRLTPPAHRIASRRQSMPRRQSLTLASP